MSERREVTIDVPVLTRVEGEGALDLTMRDGVITDLKLRIFEPPRLFEKLLEGRHYDEIPDIVARICGICPVAYQMSASHAIEQILGIEPGPWVRAMRRLFYCGEWIESHALHIHLLAAPDFVGCNSAIEMAQHYPDEVRRGLKLQALGNELIKMVGARSVHPVGARIGGFHKAPSQQAADAMLAKLQMALPEAEALVRWVSQLPLPEDDQQFISVALHHGSEYPFNEGRLVSSAGLDIPIERFHDYFRGIQVDHSTALHCRHFPNGYRVGDAGVPYLVGPLARLNLNLGQLPPMTRQLLDECNIRFPSRNMFYSVVARAAELHFAISEAIAILEEYRPEQPAYVPTTPKAGIGYGCTEAPRGILWHRYELDEQGLVVNATITPPTSQNQARIEEDLKNSLSAFENAHDDVALRLRGEQVIRNYDPCISCATHFLKVNVTR